MSRDDALHHYSQRNAINNALAAAWWPARSLSPEIPRRVENMGIAQAVEQAGSQPRTGEVANAIERLRRKAGSLADLVKMLNNAFQPVLRAETKGDEAKTVPVAPAASPLGGVLGELEHELEAVGQSLASIIARIEL